jgi:hypothetical protein
MAPNNNIIIFFTTHYKIGDYGGMIDNFANLSFNKDLSSNPKSLALHLMTYWTLKTQRNTSTLGATPPK